MHKLCLFFALVIHSTVCFSQSHHIIGLDAAVGYISHDDTEQLEQLNDIGTIHSSVYYLHQFNEYFALGVGYMTGNSEGAELIALTDLLTDSYLQYHAPSVKLMLQIPAGEGKALYIGGDLLKYDYGVLDDDRILTEQRGSGASWNIGYKRTYSFGLGLKFGWERIRMGRNVDISSLTFGAYYRF